MSGTSVFCDPCVLCQVCGQRPATHYTITLVALSAWDAEQDLLLVCDGLVCLGLAQVCAEGAGIYVDTECLDRATAELVSGLELGEAAA